MTRRFRRLRRSPWKTAATKPVHRAKRAAGHKNDSYFFHTTICTLSKNGSRFSRESFLCARHRNMRRKEIMFCCALSGKRPSGKSALRGKLRRLHDKPFSDFVRCLLPRTLQNPRKSSLPAPNFPSGQGFTRRCSNLRSKPVTLQPRIHPMELKIRSWAHYRGFSFLRLHPTCHSMLCWAHVCAVWRDFFHPSGQKIPEWAHSSAKKEKFNQILCTHRGFFRVIG